VELYLHSPIRLHGVVLISPLLLPLPQHYTASHLIVRLLRRLNSVFSRSQLRTGQPVFGSQEGQVFFLGHRVQTSSGSHPPPMQWFKGDLPLGLKWLEGGTVPLHIVPRLRTRGALCYKFTA
jgi:hypothetical protein